MSTTTGDRTDTDIPRSTWDALQRDVLDERSREDPPGYALAMDGVTIRRHTAALRYDLTTARGRAGAEWMRTICRRLLEGASYDRPMSLDGKGRVLRRVEVELGQALRRGVS